MVRCCFWLFAALSCRTTFYILSCIFFVVNHFFIYFFLASKPQEIYIISSRYLNVNTYFHQFSTYNVTEKEGFEPSRRYKRPIPLAGAPLQPLEYFSVIWTNPFLWNCCVMWRKNYYTKNVCVCQIFFYIFTILFCITNLSIHQW